MARLPHWPERLDAVIATARDTPFAWGRHDCVTFAAACVEAVTGIDPIADLRAWADRHQVRDRIAQISGKRHGGLRTAIDVIFQRYGWPVTPVRHLRIGDIALATIKRRQLTTVCFGADLAAPGPERLQRLPLTAASIAWRIG